jgi:peptide-methionine (S)-S-oxide reductase
MNTIFFGGGCFWCIEAPFLLLKGVQNVTSGYMGGDLKNPTYEMICSGQSGHAEVVKIEYDANLVSLESLLDVFFTIHDPTTLNKQGADEGTQYRSIIFVEEHHFDNAIFLIDKICNLNNFENRFVTEVLSVKSDDWSGASGDIKKTFWPAENYHANYFNKNQNNSYCSIVIAPKINKIQMIHSNLIKK